MPTALTARVPVWVAGKPEVNRVTWNYFRIARFSNGFIERAPEHRAHAHSFPESAPPIKR
jgi:hypothetical protein